MCGLMSDLVISNVRKSMVLQCLTSYVMTPNVLTETTINQQLITINQQTLPRGDETV